jgi:iron complex outermembrane receptor protein
VVVDRGPGNASQLGQATYGGNINMYSRAVATRGVRPRRSAELEQLYRPAGIAIGQDRQAERRQIRADGPVSALGRRADLFAGQSKNLFFKGVIPSARNTLTVLSTWNRNFYYQSDVLKGATCGVAQSGYATLKATNCAASSNIGMYGLNYGMGGDPTKQDYWKYNRTDKTTDFSYIRLQSDLSEHLSLDNRAYMYGYTNNTMSGNTTAW